MGKIRDAVHADWLDGAFDTNRATMVNTAPLSDEELNVRQIKKSIEILFKQTGELSRLIDLLSKKI
jgi:hypothetical protein